MNKKAILVVSFGTSHLDTKSKTIDYITDKIKNEFPEYEIYEAFTSGIIKKVLMKRENLHVFNVEEAMEQMLLDGITEVIVQPTHILNGIEYEKMLSQMEPYKEKFNAIRSGLPLLTHTEDYLYFIENFMQEMPKLKQDEALVLMGHGSDHYINVTYSAMNDMFRAKGHEHVYVGTVEAYPYLEDIMKRMEKEKYEKVYLTPFMIVAGEHVKNDMLGEEEDSWLNELERAGYEVDPICKGLGEYEFVSTIFTSHIHDILKEERA